MTSYGMQGPYSGQRIKGTGGSKISQIPNFTPEGMELYQRMFSQVAPDSYTARLAQGNPEMFEQLEAPAHRQFNEKMGQTASRFSMGGVGNRRSSGFQNTTNQASSDFAQDLQSQRMALQRQAIMDLQSMSSNLLGQRPYETYATPKKKSFWESFLPAAAPAIGAGIGFAAGGVPGAGVGYKAGQGFQQGFQ